MEALKEKKRGKQQKDIENGGGSTSKKLKYS